MSIRTELLQSKKLTTAFQIAIARLDEGTDPDTPLFSAVVRTTADREDPRSKFNSISSQFTAAAGFTLGMIIGDIATLHNITLNGLKALNDSCQIEAIEAPRSLHP